MSTARKILELNAFDKDAADDLDAGTSALVARRHRTFGPASMLFYKRPLNLVRGEGVWLIGADGTRFLDAYNNVPSVGHCHPAVVAAVARQLATLNTHTRYLSDAVYAYAERLLATFPAELSNVVFTCTGSESVDLALRIARNVTGGTGFIVTENAYHGNTASATQVSPSSASGEPPSPNVFPVPAPDTYRRPRGKIGALFAADVSRAIEAMRANGIRLAGMIADSIFSSDGVYPGKPGFLAAAVQAVRKAGGLYIADEVQPGFARTGEKFWGFERHGVVPDMVVLGKPMGNGYPIGGVVAKPDLLAEFGSKSGYFNTFGGSPAAAAAGLAVLETIEAEGLQKNALDTGAYLADRLKTIAQRREKAADVRGAGLYIGVEFVRDCKSREPDAKAALAAVEGLRERNILIGVAGRHGNILKIRPPLCFGREHADMLVEGLGAVLNEQDL